ncbi:MAG: glutathione synthase, partial [Gammaproteobacteria bacterium]|nr:glutathione synthase [Gammaproteobacteria bacterium]
MSKNTPRIAVLMDPIQSIKPYKDTSFAMMLEAQQRGWELLYLEIGDLSLIEGRLWIKWRKVEVKDNNEDWFRFLDEGFSPVEQVTDCILMRKDPPFNMDYIYATYLLDYAQGVGVIVVNSPRGLREVNEKLYTAWFPQCAPLTLVSSSRDQLKAFVKEQGDAIVKPLDMMGGASIFRVKADDPN